MPIYDRFFQEGLTAMADEIKTTAAEAPESRNFIHTFIEEDIAQGGPLLLFLSFPDLARRFFFL